MANEFIQFYCYRFRWSSGRGPIFKKPVLVIRKFTERVESLELGISKLIGTDRDSIVKHISELLDNKEIYAQMIPKSNPYGDGKASERIAKIIIDSERSK